MHVNRNEYKSRHILTIYSDYMYTYIYIYIYIHIIIYSYNCTVIHFHILLVRTHHFEWVRINQFESINQFELREHPSHGLRRIVAGANQLVASLTCAAYMHRPHATLAC